MCIIIENVRNIDLFELFEDILTEKKTQLWFDKLNGVTLLVQHYLITEIHSQRNTLPK